MFPVDRLYCMGFYIIPRVDCEGLVGWMDVKQR